MNIFIDATWVGEMYGTKVMHGGYRVTNELLKRLTLFPQHQFYLTNTNYHRSGIENIKRYIIDNDLSLNVFANARSFGFLESSSLRKAYLRINRFIPIPTIIPFYASQFGIKMNVYHSPVDPIPGVIRRNMNVKKFFTALDLIPLVRPDLSTVFQDYTRLLYDSLTPEVNILAISECTKRDLLKYRPDIHPEKIRVTYLAADKKLFYYKNDQGDHSSNLEKYKVLNKQYFLTVNSMAKYKNVEFILDNFMNYIRETANSSLKLVVVGQNREVNFKEHITQKYGSSDSIILLDYVDDESLADLYNGSLGFLYMSRYEGFGLPILEAMQSGTPVICSNAASLPEVAGNAAIIMDPSDNKAFITALDQVYQYQSVRDKLIVSGLEQAARFSWEKYAGEVVKAYEEM